MSDADGVGHVPDSYFRHFLKGFRKGLFELLRFGQVAPWPLDSVDFIVFTKAIIGGLVLCPDEERLPPAP